jgi:hypothetical protein
MTVIKIVCGCNSDKAPAVFSNVTDAENHARSTSHILHGSITVDPKPSTH